MLVEELKDLGFDLTSKKAIRFYGSNENKKASVIKIKNIYYLHNKHLQSEGIEDTYGMFGHKYSKTLVLDFDMGILNKYSSQEITELTTSLLGNPCLIENRNDGTNGMHLYFNYDKPVFDDQAKKIKGILREKFDIVCDIRTSNQALRLPNSFNYNIVHMDLNIINNISLLRNTVKYYSEIEPVFLTKRKSNVYKNKSYSITRGNRVGGSKYMISLGFKAIEQNYSIDEFINSVIESNISSKDISENGKDWIRRECEKIYQWCKRNYKPINTSSSSSYIFVSNKYRLSEKEIFECKIKAEELSLKYPERYREMKRKSFEICLIEVIGAYRYQKENPRKIREDIALSNKKRKEYSVGYQFNTTWQYNLKKFYNLKSDVRKDISIILNLYFTQYKHNNRGWTYDSIYGCSKQFIKNSLLFFYTPRGGEQRYSHLYHAKPIKFFKKGVDSDFTVDIYWYRDRDYG